MARVPFPFQSEDRCEDRERTDARTPSPPCPLKDGHRTPRQLTTRVCTRVWGHCTLQSSPGPRQDLGLDRSLTFLDLPTSPASLTSHLTMGPQSTPRSPPTHRQGLDTIPTVASAPTHPLRGGWATTSSTIAGFVQLLLCDSHSLNSV